MLRTIRPAEKMVWKCLTPFSKLTIFWDIIALKEYFTVTALLISTTSLTQSNYSEASDSILKIGHLLGRNGFCENFTVRAPKCRFDDKHHKTS